MQTGESQDRGTRFANARLEPPDRLFPQRVLGQLMIHAIDMLGDIGEADTQLPQFLIVLRRKEMRRQPDFIKRAPKSVLAMGIIGLLQRGLPACGCAAEHQFQSRSQPVGKDMFLDHQGE